MLSSSREAISKLRAASRRWYLKGATTFGGGKRCVCGWLLVARIPVAYATGQLPCVALSPLRVWDSSSREGHVDQVGQLCHCAPPSNVRRRELRPPSPPRQDPRSSAIDNDKDKAPSKGQSQQPW